MLTEKRIRDTKPESRTRILWDGQVKGLGVRVTPGGVKSYVLFYRVGDRKRLATMARTSEISLRTARERAGEELASIRAGGADPLKRRRDAQTAPTVNEGLDRYFDEYVPKRMDAGRLAPSTVRKYRTLAERYVRPTLGSRRVAEVTIRDLERMAMQITSNVQQNRTVTFASKLFNMFETWEWRPQHSNPARGIEKAREEERDRTLSPTELSTLSEALTKIEGRHPAPVAAIRFLTVTGLRVSETLAIRWEHVDFESSRVTLPATKTGRRTHDLSTAAIVILTALPRTCPWTFTTGGKAAVTYRHVRAVFKDACKAAGISGATLHDIRRTVMTTAARVGVGTHVLRDLLGHKTTVMADRYIRAVGDPVRDAREQVSGVMEAMMTAKPKADVVSIRK